MITDKHDENLLLTTKTCVVAMKNYHFTVLLYRSLGCRLASFTATYAGAGNVENRLTAGVTEAKGLTPSRLDTKNIF